MRFGLKLFRRKHHASDQPPQLLSKEHRSDSVIEDFVTPICVAPMQGVTNTHWRHMFRGISKHTKIYGPMSNADDVVSGNHPELLYCAHEEGMVAFQLGGTTCDSLAAAAAMVEATGNFCEINLAMGSPGANGHGGLMKDPERVRQIIYNVNRQVTRTPVTVKCRVGFDGHYDYTKLHDFVQHVKEGGAHHIVVHARTCFVEGLHSNDKASPPPLDYQMVHRLVSDFPDMTICLNGGVSRLEGAHIHLQHTPPDAEGNGEEPEWASTGGYGTAVHSVMYGRAAWHDPWLFSNADSMFFGAKDPGFSKREVIQRYVDYLDDLVVHDGVVCDSHALFQPLKFLLPKEATAAVEARLDPSVDRTQLVELLRDELQSEHAQRLDIVE